MDRVLRVLQKADDFVSDRVERDLASLAEKIVQVHGTECDDEDVAAYVGSSALCDPGYERIAGKILLDAKTGHVPEKFSEAARGVDLLSPAFARLIESESRRLDELCSWAAAGEIKWTFCSASMIVKTYLLRNEKMQICERPEHMFMRCALAATVSQDGANEIEGALLDLDYEALERCFRSLVSGEISFPSPVLFRSCTRCQQVASCFVLEMGDSMESIADCMSKFTMASQHGGGVGISFSKIRSKGSLIRSVNGEASGIVPMARQFNELSKFVNQGGKRPGAIAIYLEPWHAQVMDLLTLRSNRGGSEELKARDVHVGLWMPRLFFERLARDEQWSLMSPDKCPGLSDVYGDEFERKYREYEATEGAVTERMRARDLWQHILVTQIETGEPFLVNKDECNEKNVNADLGTIKCPNLCTEILQYTDERTPAVCILGTICLNRLVTDELGSQQTQSGKGEILTKDFLSDRPSTFPEFEDDDSESDTLPSPSRDDARKKVEKFRKDSNSSLSDHPSTFPELDDIANRAEQEQHNTKYNTKRTKQHSTVAFSGFDSARIVPCGTVLYSTVPKVPEDGSSSVEGGVSPADGTGKTFDFARLETLTKDLVRYLNRFVDSNKYPFESARRSCQSKRPLGIGVQGFGDMLASMGIPFESERARSLNEKIFRSIYLAAAEESVDLGIREPARFVERFRKLHTDFYPDDGFCGANLRYDDEEDDCLDLNHRLRFVRLRKNVERFGMVNSLLTALPPTASTAKICNNTESVDPIMCVSLRRLLSGEFLTVNPVMAGLIWNRCRSEAIRESSRTESNRGNSNGVKSNGKESVLESVRADQRSDRVSVDRLALELYKRQMYRISRNSDVDACTVLDPDERGLFKSIWKVDQEKVLDMCRDRSPYVDQGQSTTLYFGTNSIVRLSNALMHAARLGLKNLNYYVRVQRIAKPLSCLEDECVSCSG